MMRFIVGNIREYDIAQCNINIMYKKLQCITKEKYDELANGSKQSRVVTVGLMIKTDPALYTNLKAAVDGVMNLFIESNKIDETCILERCHDAIWINNIYPSILTIDGIELKDKRQATALLEIDRFKFYFNSITGEFFTRFVGDNFSETLKSHILKYMTLKCANQYKRLYTEYHKDRINNQADVNYMKYSDELMGLI